MLFPHCSCEDSSDPMPWTILQPQTAHQCETGRGLRKIRGFPGILRGRGGDAIPFPRFHPTPPQVASDLLDPAQLGPLLPRMENGVWQDGDAHGPKKARPPACFLKKVASGQSHV